MKFFRPKIFMLKSNSFFRFVRSNIKNKKQSEYKWLINISLEFKKKKKYKINLALLVAGSLITIHSLTSPNLPKQSRKPSIITSFTSVIKKKLQRITVHVVHLSFTYVPHIIQQKAFFFLQAKKKMNIHHMQNSHCSLI